MMKLEVFAEVVKEKIKTFLPEKYSDYEVCLNNVNKVNKSLLGLMLTDPRGNTRVMPNIYLEGFYETYKETEDLNQCLINLAVTIDEAMQNTPEQYCQMQGQGFLQQLLPENIYYQLINTEQNREYLNDKPNREYMDMSVIYRYRMEAGESGIASVVITDRIAQQKGYSEEELFEIATKNTKELFPIKIASMAEVLTEMMRSDGMPKELIQAMIGDDISENPMYVISNQQGISGATTMLYEDGLQPLAEKLDNNLYVLPSSLHELIAVPASTDFQAGELAEMVRQVNGSQVALEDRLSNNVYFYDKETRELSMATDVPERGLEDYEMPAKAI